MYGTLLEQGLGVPKDLVKAKEMFERAANKGHRLAAEGVERLNKLIEEEETEQKAAKEISLKSSGSKLSSSQEVQRETKTIQKGKFTSFLLLSCPQ
jgi:TPR repeat protein